MPRLGPCVPLHCPTTGMSMVPLGSLVQYLGAWLALAPSDHQTRLCDSVYLTSTKFRGIHFNSVKAADAVVLLAEMAVLLAKDAIESVPPVDMKTGFYSPYFTVPKTGDGLRPTLDLHVLN